MRTVAWDVFLEKKRFQRHPPTWSAYTAHIDTVWFDEDLGADYVYWALVEHDGYSPNIEVVPDTSKFHELAPPLFMQRKDEE